ncbi:hypothetical protein ACQPZG_06235 [Streptomyces sp. CA-294286]|uniref:hypothetical protein n=1 Tax=Streptomyces sp. CA-294286 TaxID=3240070 RepID=UPI003D8F545A
MSSGEINVFVVLGGLLLGTLVVACFRLGRIVTELQKLNAYRAAEFVHSARNSDRMDSR